MLTVGNLLHVLFKLLYRHFNSLITRFNYFCAVFVKRITIGYMCFFFFAQSELCLFHSRAWWYSWLCNLATRLLHEQVLYDGRNLGHEISVTSCRNRTLPPYISFDVNCCFFFALYNANFHSPVKETFFFNDKIRPYVRMRFFTYFINYAIV